jgi:hypothetical protein
MTNIKQQKVTKPRGEKKKLNMTTWSVAWILGVITMGSVWWTYNHYFDDQFVKGWCTAVTSRSERDWIFEKIGCFKQFPELEEKDIPYSQDYSCPTMESIEDGSCIKDPNNKVSKEVK